jgi:hypothetical protein
VETEGKSLNVVAMAMATATATAMAMAPHQCEAVFYDLSLLHGHQLSLHDLPELQFIQLV